ncbi:ParB/RepB/Spo0J family partition protein [Bifidobacterium aemilianum]
MGSADQVKAPASRSRNTVAAIDSDQSVASTRSKKTKTASSSVVQHEAKHTRKAIPSLEDIAHPLDVFFGGGGQPADTGKAAAGAKTASTGGTRAQKANPESESGPAEKAAGDAPARIDELKPVAGGYLAELKLDQVGPNLYQPRTIFDEDELRELAQSITEVGVLQPIVVRKRPADQHEKNSDSAADEARWAQYGHTEYEIIMGERRWRASRLAGMETIPAIVKTTADDDMLRDALLENLHRVALNPLEEAAAYQQMIEEFGLTQAQLSKSVSKSRPQIANTLRLLNLPGVVQKKVAAGVLSAGHARALLGLTDEAEMESLANRIISEGLSVRSAEEIVAMKTMGKEQKPKEKSQAKNPWAQSPQQSILENRFDTKVSIKGTRKHGRIEIVFSSPEDMDRIMALLVPEAESKSASNEQWV